MDYHRSAEVEVESSIHMVLESALMMGGSLVTLLLRARAEVSYGGEEPGHSVVKVQGWCCIFVKLKLELAVSWCKQTPNVVQCSQLKSQGVALDQNCKSGGQGGLTIDWFLRRFVIFHLVCTSYKDP
ncbi:hypothetical protein L1987_54331 [Smallanthus sonchifolius]|uniref:Uncharacterized protein n=1 Tax=Smallanthus sonchifolius TaxID=185202 RepID=A0ACB9E6X7_9ASTR|nr:hypothetical protein L1987_54331 [Smallanthus sonchifolius]